MGEFEMDEYEEGWKIVVYYECKPINAFGFSIVNADDEGLERYSGISKRLNKSYLRNLAETKQNLETHSERINPVEVVTLDIAPFGAKLRKITNTQMRKVLNALKGE